MQYSIFLLIPLHHLHAYLTLTKLSLYKMCFFFLLKAHKTEPYHVGIESWPQWSYLKGVKC